MGGAVAALMTARIYSSSPCDQVWYQTREAGGNEGTFQLDDRGAIEQLTSVCRAAVLQLTSAPAPPAYIKATAALIGADAPALSICVRR